MTPDDHSDRADVAEAIERQLEEIEEVRRAIVETLAELPDPVHEGAGRWRP